MEETFLIIILHSLSLIYKTTKPPKDETLEIEITDLFLISLSSYFIAHNSLINDTKRGEYEFSFPY